MAKFSFTSFNKQRLFNVDTTDFDYVSLEDLYNRDGAGHVYLVTGLYIGTKSIYADEAPLLATDEEYVNLPEHQLSEVKAMMGDSRAVAEINSGNCGFVIDTYYQKRFKKTCYVARWVDYNEAIAEK